ncbi:MAG: cryptochrome/photolyase family protein [Verrucomicrobiales bacterium]
MPKPAPIRRLIFIAGDQLDQQAKALTQSDPKHDVVVMGEVDEEASYVWSHQRRLVYFFSAMRHFRDALQDKGWRVDYQELQDKAQPGEARSLSEQLGKAVERWQPEEIWATEPGDWRVEVSLTQTAKQLQMPLRWQEDAHFLLSRDEFAQYAEGRKSFMMELFYRWMRKKHDILMEADKPVGGDWNYDAENRASFGKKGPPAMASWPGCSADQTTEKVRAMVKKRFAEHPGSSEDWDLPVTPADARNWLKFFVGEHLSQFGQFQDAMWNGESFLRHSRLSALMNIKLLHPREVIDAALSAWQEGQAPLASVEGFVRQILGWREYVRGLYWTHMPGYAELNALNAQAEVPSSFWDGKTEMACVGDAMKTVLRFAYAHHIQRLMVLGLYSQMAGVHPYKFHQWHMAMYADAIDWVSLPNTLGMSQFGDGGIVGTKPYCATGNYIKRMSNACAQCRFDPAIAVGPKACPFTTLYWDFLARHEKAFRSNRRMAFQIKNLDRKTAAQLKEIRNHAEKLKSNPV